MDQEQRSYSELVAFNIRLHGARGAFNTMRHERDALRAALAAAPKPIRMNSDRTQIIDTGRLVRDYGHWYDHERQSALGAPDG